MLLHSWSRHALPAQDFNRGRHRRLAADGLPAAIYSVCWPLHCALVIFNGCISSVSSLLDPLLCQPPLIGRRGSANDFVDGMDDFSSETIAKSRRGNTCSLDSEVEYGLEMLEGGTRHRVRVHETMRLSGLECFQHTPHLAAWRLTGGPGMPWRIFCWTKWWDWEAEGRDCREIVC